MQQIMVGVDPHKLSATSEVVDQHERLLGSGRFATDKAGYAAMLGYVAQWSRPTWAIEGSNGAGHCCLRERGLLEQLLSVRWAHDRQ
ncbi:MAG: hypothetical protein Q8Q02_08095 [Nocardioides sp.]|nr:hypothetical protein [Nocardioides sp.]